MPRIGLCLANWLPLTVLRQAAQAAEARGYEICWITEGLGKDTPSQIAALSLATSRIKFGPGILTIFTRTPALMAQVSASLDEISNGRFILGIGSGHGPSLYNCHGITLERPFQRMRDYVHVIREAMKNGRVSYEGKVCTIPNLVLLSPPTQRKVPLYLAALGPKMAELAGELADGVLFNMTTVEYMRDVVPRIKEAARRAGRDPEDVDIACLIQACAGGAEAEMECRRRVANYVALPFYQNMLSLSGYAEDVEKVTRALSRGGKENFWGPPGLDEGAKAVSDRMMDALALSGDTKEWPKKVDKYREAGVSLPCPFFNPVGPDPAKAVLEGISAFSG